MELLTIILIAIGLAMDAFAVSIVDGSAYKRLHVKHAFRIAFLFGLFQALMPLVGSLAGLTLKEYIETDARPANGVVLLVLSIATSIDALAVGITLPLLNVSLILAVTIIGLITFIISYVGVYIGQKFGHFFESKIEIIGGIVLILIGFKILFEHLFAV
ncbi:MAG: manganese efflux pump MntP [Planctomycetota bacterium]|jgi:putative Mn2+ efflux pump MntP